MLHKAQTTARLTPCEDLQRSAAQRSRSSS
jgi:hypothetical protein